jgi:hypothetical protein
MASPGKTQTNLADETHGTNIRHAQSSADLSIRAAHGQRAGSITHEQQSAAEGNEEQLEVCWS